MGSKQGCVFQIVQPSAAYLANTAVNIGAKWNETELVNLNQLLN